MIISIEAMHLLPRPFDIQAPHPPPRVVCGMTALLLPAVVRFFSKACRTSSRGRLFRFGPRKYRPVPKRPLAIIAWWWRHHLRKFSCLFPDFLSCSCGPCVSSSERRQTCWHQTCRTTM